MIRCNKDTDDRELKSAKPPKIIIFKNFWSDSFLALKRKIMHLLGRDPWPYAWKLNLRSPDRLFVYPIDQSSSSHQPYNFFTKSWA